MRTKRNNKMVLVRIRIKIGIALNEIKTKGHKSPKNVRVKRTSGSKGRQGQKDVRVQRTSGFNGRKGSMVVRAETNNKTVMIRTNIGIAS